MLEPREETGRRLRAWWAAPEQALLRAETRWTIRWMTRRWGLVWIILLVGARVAGTATMPTLMRSGALGSLAMAPWTSAITLVPALALYAIWLFLIRERSMAPFAPGRIQDVVLTPMDRRLLWPALLAAPLLFVTCARLLEYCAGVGFSFLLRGSEATRAALAQAGIQMPELPGYWMALQQSLDLAAFVAVALAVTAYATLRSLPDGGYVRLTIAGILCRIGIALPGYIVYMCYFMFFGFRQIVSTALPATVPASGPASMPAFAMSSSMMKGIFVMAAIWSLISLLIATLVWFGCLRGLRGEKLWRKLMEAAGTMK